MQFTTVAAPVDGQLDALIVPAFESGEAASGTPAGERQTVSWLAAQLGPRRLFTATTHLRPDLMPARLVLVNAGEREDYDVERAWRVVSAGMRALWPSEARRVGVVVDIGQISAGEAVQAAVEGVHFGSWRPETHRTDAVERHLPPIDEAVVIVGDAQIDADEPIRRGDAVGRAVTWARQLANEPANLMTPTHVAQAAEQLAAESGLSAEVLDEDACRALGMNSYLSVAQGSDQPAKFIVLRYQGRQGDGYDLALVGKGITFDSGGISIKPSQDMHLMKYDMSGAAGVIASASAIAHLGLPLNVITVAPCTENLPGGHATKPGDVFTSMSGKTIEVINTDAEGRLVLIDGVTYAQREGASRVVDVATLTGAIAVALGHHYAGVFGRPEGFVDAVLHAGEAAGERLWPMPLADEYREGIKSDIADIKNTGGRMGGAIYGAAFIDAVVEPETEWVHLDIASTGWAEHDRPFSPKGPQGASVRTIVELASSIASRSR